MKKIVFTSALVLLVVSLFAQTKPSLKTGKSKSKEIEVTCLKATCKELKSTKTDVRYGSPLCIEVDGVNNFFVKSYSTYTPVNFDFNTKGFTDIKIEEKAKDAAKSEPSKNNADANIMSYNIEKSFKIDNQMWSLNAQIDRFENKSAPLTPEESEEVRKLKKELETLKTKKEELEKQNEELKSKNKALQKKFDSIYNVTVKTQEFIGEFKKFQTHFSNIDKYTTLKNSLLNLVKKDSVFICDKNNFIARCSSTFISVYGSSDNHLQKKEMIINELAAIDASYTKLVSIYQQLNTLYKNSELKLSGELKDGKNSLKFDKVKGSFETKYLFEDEMKKAKTINETYLIQENTRKMINEANEGIDLFDEIKNDSYTTTIISQNIYDDEADIEPQFTNSKGKCLFKYRSFKVRTYGNWKVNGSAGYFLNFISDDNYTLRKAVETDSDSKAGVFGGSKNILKHSLGALLHAYYNFKGDIDMGLSVGLSINDNANAGFYFGLSTFVMEKNRLVITSGVSFVKVKRLNTANLAVNETQGDYDFTNAGDTEIKYDEVYRPSFFIGVSYNLSK
ncbi:hypothetical protein [Flavobacterium sp.]|uniref:hypothetical protein n=1 Tax=Flavobacterium sp. TaxID=239 RepID=UPI00262BF8D6|nr:hypothetical protein [Flavobacterium sp.]